MDNKTLFDRFLDFFYINRCLGCARILPEADSVLCPYCRMRYQLLHHRKCRECGRDLCTCECTKQGIESLGVWRLGKLCAYLPSERNTPLMRMLYFFKHKNNRASLELFASEMADMIGQRCSCVDFTICYVPRSVVSYKKYGYDHMRELSYLVAQKLGIECESLFFRDKKARVQKDLGRAARFYNAQQSIMLREVQVSERRFILLDDVCVTGASLGRCASLLIGEGAREVRCFVIAVRP